MPEKKKHIVLIGHWAILTQSRFVCGIQTHPIYWPLSHKSSLHSQHRASLQLLPLVHGNDPLRGSQQRCAALSSSFIREIKEKKILLQYVTLILASHGPGVLTIYSFRWQSKAPDPIEKSLTSLLVMLSALLWFTWVLLLSYHYLGSPKFTISTEPQAPLSTSHLPTSLNKQSLMWRNGTEWKIQPQLPKVPQPHRSPD